MPPGRRPPAFGMVVVGDGRADSWPAAAPISATSAGSSARSCECHAPVRKKLTPKPCGSSAPCAPPACRGTRRVRLVRGEGRGVST